MDTDWMKKFDKINIPCAYCFVHEHQVNKRVEKANKKLNQYYADCVRQSAIKLTFAEEVVLNPSTYS